MVGAGWANSSSVGMTQLTQERMIERIIVMGLKTAPSKLIVTDDDVDNYNTKPESLTEATVPILEEAQM